MKHEHRWVVSRVVKEVFILRCDEDQTEVRDSDGRLVEYPSQDAARFVAEHWDDFRAPPYAQLRGMSDDELRQAGRRIGALESELV